MAFRAAPDLEAQPQDCAWSTVFNHGSVFSRHDDPPIPTLSFLNRGSVLSRHDDPPMPSLLPFPDDPPPGYTYPPPLPPISGSDPSESVTNGTVDRHSKLFAIALQVILVVALFATAIYFTFFNHSKV